MKISRNFAVARETYATEEIRVRFDRLRLSWSTIHMSNAGTRWIVHLAAAHPNLEAQLILFAAPNTNLLVVAAQLPEPFPWNGEQATSHDWTFEWLRWTFEIFGQRRQQFVIEVPIERATCADGIAHLMTIFECAVFDGIDVRTDDNLIIPRNRIYKQSKDSEEIVKQNGDSSNQRLTKQRRQPIDICFAMRIEINQDFGLCCSSTGHFGRNQSNSFWKPNDLHFWQITRHIIVQLFACLFVRAAVIDENYFVD